MDDSYSSSYDLLQVTKRLQQELMSLMMSTDKGISAFPDGDKLLSWIGTVQGPEGSVYEGNDSLNSGPFKALRKAPLTIFIIQMNYNLLCIILLSTVQAYFQ